MFCTVVDATSQYVVRLGRVRSHQVSESAAGSSRGHDLVICWLEKLSEVKWRKQSEDVTGCDDGVWNPLTWHDVAWGCDGLKSDVCRGDEKVSPEQGERERRCKCGVEDCGYEAGQGSGGGGMIGNAGGGGMLNTLCVVAECLVWMNVQLELVEAK